MYILHDLHMLMAKAVLTTPCSSPRLPLLGCLFLLAIAPTGTALFLIIRGIVSVLRFLQIMKLD